MADATDRQPFRAGESGSPSRPASNNADANRKPLFEGITESEKGRAAELAARKKVTGGPTGHCGQSARVSPGPTVSRTKIHLLYRGDPEQPREAVAPAIPAVLGDLKLPENPDEPTRRRRLAEWLADPANPLTARVMVKPDLAGTFWNRPGVHAQRFRADGDGAPAILNCWIG